MMQPCKPQAGRPKDQAKRAAILAAARCHFLQNGFDRASMDAIAASANVSKLTVYSHFGSKDALFKELIEGECCKHKLTEEFSAMLDLPPDEALKGVGMHFIGMIFHPEAIDMHRVILAEAIEKPKISELFYEAGPGPVRKAFSTYLDALTQRGQLAVDNSERATNHFLQMLKGDLHFRCLLNLSRPTEEELKAHVEDVVAVFLRAYAVIWEDAHPSRRAAHSSP
jgi:TetR/AcrR family transcriptional repressor of mexJK operon